MAMVRVALTLSNYAPMSLQNATEADVQSIQADVCRLMTRFRTTDRVVSATEYRVRNVYPYQ